MKGELEKRICEEGGNMLEDIPSVIEIDREKLEGIIEEAREDFLKIIPLEADPNPERKAPPYISASAVYGKVKKWFGDREQSEELSLEGIKEKLNEGRTVCLSCGYSGDDIQGEYPVLYRGYGCPKCHSPLTVVKEREDV